MVIVLPSTIVFEPFTVIASPSIITTASVSYSLMEGDEDETLVWIDDEGAQLDAAYRNLEELRDKLQQAEERLFDVGLYFSMYGDTEKELAEVESEIKSLLDARLIRHTTDKLLIEVGKREAV